MSINRDKPDFWKNDIVQSVDLYNKWFMEFAPRAFRETRMMTANSVELALMETDYLQNISAEILKMHPEILPILRMSTCPPIARDRLIGLAGVTKSLVENMENISNPHISSRMPPSRLLGELSEIARTINKMVDPDIFPWLPAERKPINQEIQRSATVVADRLCGALTIRLSEMLKKNVNLQQSQVSCKVKAILKQTLERNITRWQLAHFHFIRMYLYSLQSMMVIELIFLWMYLSFLNWLRMEIFQF